MTETAHSDPVPLDLSPEEAWVAHAAVLQSLERDAEDVQHTATAESAADARRRAKLLETVEDDGPFTLTQLQSLRTLLQTYFGDAPHRDRETAIAVLTVVDTALA